MLIRGAESARAKNGFDRDRVANLARTSRADHRSIIDGNRQCLPPIDQERAIPNVCNPWKAAIRLMAALAGKRTFWPWAAPRQCSAYGYINFRMFWIMFAAQMSAAAPISSHVPDVRYLFSYQDVPDYLIGSGEVRRIVYTRTTVRDNGSVQNCVTELPSGDTKLDAYTCALILKRAKFAPAKWIDGTPAYSVLRFPVSWT